MDFKTMSVEDAIKYCYKHEAEYKYDISDSCPDSEKLFNSLISILEDGTIKPSELPDYGMDFGE